MDDTDIARIRQTQSWSPGFHGVDGEHATGGRDDGMTNSTENFQTNMVFHRQPKGNGTDVHSPNIFGFEVDITCQEKEQMEDGQRGNSCFRRMSLVAGGLEGNEITLLEK